MGNQDITREPRLSEVEAGLRGVVVAETRLGDVLGEEGFFHYRGWDAIDLAGARTFEEVWHLLWFGEFPLTGASSFSRQIATARAVPPGVLDSLRTLFQEGLGVGSVGRLRSALSIQADSLDLLPVFDMAEESIKQAALGVVAAFPTVVAAAHRNSLGREIVAPDLELPQAANFLYMLSGETPTEDRARGLEQYLISTLEHGLNASAFTARVIASTGADLGAAFTGALGALSGPLHGGAPGRVLEMLDEIGEPGRAHDWIDAKLTRGERLMGFGHPVYRTEDPRSSFLRGVAQRLGGDRVALAVHVEAAALQLLAERRPKRPLKTNVEFFASVVLEACGLPQPLFTPTFAIARLVGWAAHIFEQANQSQVIRPSSRYVGPPPGQRAPSAA